MMKVSDNSGDVPVITIDGPSGSGKGTIAQAVARRLGWHLLDSGALYRVLAFRAIRDQLDLADVAALVTSAGQMQLQFRGSGELPAPVCLDGVWVTSDLRTEEVGKAASVIAAHGAVRDILLQRQRDFCQAPGLVADGRDMGTVVFPRARVKIYLTASAQARAERRVKQLKQNGQLVEEAVILQQIQARDYQDSHRAVAPLKPAEDAVLLDSTALSIEQVMERVLGVIEQAYPDKKE